MLRSILGDSPFDAGDILLITPGHGTASSFRRPARLRNCSSFASDIEAFFYANYSILTATMPLDDASPQAAEYFDQQNGAPTRNNDPSLNQYHIKAELIVTPDPFTLYFGFGGPWNWKRNVASALKNRVDMCRTLIDRPPTQDEMDAFATISSRGIYYNRIGAPVAFTAYLARAYTSARKTSLYPAVMPESAHTKFPSPRQIVQGVTKFAKMDPSAFRSAAMYSAFRGFFWTLVGASISSVYATYHDAKGMAEDPRLANLLREAKQQNPEDVRKRKLQAVSDRYHHNQRVKQQGTDEGPLEQGVFAEGGQDGYQSLYNNTPETTTSTTTTEPQRFYNEPATQESTKSTNQDSVSDMFDDASPTAPEYQSTNKLSTPNTFQRGAWDRIRQQNVSGSSQVRVDPFRQPEGWTTQSSSSNNNNPGTERQQEKELARAEFERMLDAERNMSSDDGSGSGQSRGWGRW